MPAPFVIFSLPRSRSTWLSVFLSGPGAVCGHDLGMTISAPDEFVQKLRGEFVGTCETGAAFAAPLIRKMLPDARLLVIDRCPIEVCASLARLGIGGPEVEAEIWARARDLDALCADPAVMSYHYADLKRADVCADIYQQCLGRAMPYGWWTALDAVNVQVDLARNFATLRERAPSIAALKAQAHEAMAHG